MRQDLLDLAVDFGWLAEKTARYSAMTAYQHVGVASDFSPTFTAVLAEAKRFSSHCGADLEIVHAGAFDSEKEKRFLEALGQPTQIRWVQGETIAAPSSRRWRISHMSFSSPERFTAKRTTNLSLATLRGSSCAVRRAISYWCRGL